MYLILEAPNYHPPLPLGGWRVNSATDCRLFANHSSFPATLRAARTEAHSALMICMKIATTSTLGFLHVNKTRHDIKRGKWETFIYILSDGCRHQNGWIFVKVPNSLWPFPPHFRKIMLQFFLLKFHVQKALFKSICPGLFGISDKLHVFLTKLNNFTG